MIGSQTAFISTIFADKDKFCYFLHRTLLPTLRDPDYAPFGTDILVLDRVDEEMTLAQSLGVSTYNVPTANQSSLDASLFQRLRHRIQDSRTAMLIRPNQYSASRFKMLSSIPQSYLRVAIEQVDENGAPVVREPLRKTEPWDDIWQVYLDDYNNWEFVQGGWETEED